MNAVKVDFDLTSEIKHKELKTSVRRACEKNQERAFMVVFNAVYDLMHTDWSSKGISDA